MQYQRCYTAMYILLLLMSIFAPEIYGVSLRYVLVPLTFMGLFGLLGRRIALNSVKLKPYLILGLLWIVLTILSTFLSTVVHWDANVRSFCLLILYFLFLYEMVPNEKYMNIVKHVYIYLTLFCALWIILQAATGINRYEFIFVTGQKDVNYLTAFMLPGFYMALRFLLFEKLNQKIIYVLCAVATFYGILLVQSRAAFVTALLVVGLIFVEYMMKIKLSLRKIVFIICAVLLVSTVGILVWNNSSFSRLIEASSYEDNIRLIIWEYALRAFKNSPVIGSGLGASNYYAKIATNYQTHCNYLDILGDTGILGILLFSLLSFQILKVRKGERLHMISYFVACMLPFGFINGLQTIAFWLPMLLLAHEHVLIERGDTDDRNHYLAS